MCLERSLICIVSPRKYIDVIESFRRENVEIKLIKHKNLFFIKITIALYIEPQLKLIF